MKAFKGFTKDLKCRDFQFEEGKTYEEPEASLCVKGFHACENPLDCFNYYFPNKSVFHSVELDGVSDEHEGDSKVCARRITIGARLHFFDMIKAGVQFVFEKLEKEKATTGDSAHAATTGYSAHAATTGYSAHAATTGDWAHAATTGNSAHAATTGNSAHAATTGYSAHAATTGKNSISASFGIRGKAKAAFGGWIVCAEYNDDCELIAVKSARVDGETIKPDTWYMLKNGEFVEADEDDDN